MSMDDDGGGRAATARTMVGLGLLGAGALIAAWTFVQVYAVINDPISVPLVDTLSVYAPRERSIRVGDERLEVPAAFVKIGAYGTTAAFLAICGGLASGLLRAGARLLEPDGRRLVRELRRERRS